MIASGQLNLCSELYSEGNCTTTSDSLPGTFLIWTKQISWICICITLSFTISGSSQTDFAPQLEKLNKEKYTVYAFDPRGYGRSIPPERDWPLLFLQRDAEDAVTLMKVRLLGNNHTNYMICLLINLMLHTCTKHTQFYSFFLLVLHMEIKQAGKAIYINIFKVNATGPQW